MFLGYKRRECRLGWQIYLFGFYRARPELLKRAFSVDSLKGERCGSSGVNSPLWSRDGRELLYRSGNAVMGVSVETKPPFSLETPKTLFRGEYVSSVLSYSYDLVTWDISPDGKRFLMMKESRSSTGGGPRKINIVLNWFEELKQRVPVK